MVEREGTSKKRRWQQIIYIFAPFFLLLACLFLINFVPRGAEPVQQPDVGTKVGIENVATAVTAPTTPIPLPTSTAIPSPTLVPTAALPPDAAIQLLGPPDGSSFRKIDTIVFYAAWSQALAENRHVAAYVRIDGQAPIILGIMNESNSGQVYRWQLNLAEVNLETAVSLEWWVQLQTDSSSLPRLTSVARQVTLLP